MSDNTMAGMIEESIRGVVPPVIKDCFSEVSLDAVRDDLKALKSELADLVESKMSSLKSSIAELEVTHSGIPSAVENSINKSIYSTLFGEDDFPTLEQTDSSDASDGESSNPNPWTEVRRKQHTLPQVIKRSINAMNNDQNMFDQRKNNLIIYRASEVAKEEERVAADQKLIDDLLKVLKVETTPVKICRLGKVTPGSSDPRPLKIELESNEAQKEIMKKAKHLKDAPENLKKLSISYDLTRDQRAQVKGLVNEAKQK